jgi:mevalonate kinase
MTGIGKETLIITLGNAVVFNRLIQKPTIIELPSCMRFLLVDTKMERRTKTLVEHVNQRLGVTVRLHEWRKRGSLNYMITL